MLVSVSVAAYFGQARELKCPLLRVVLGYVVAIVLNHTVTIAFGRGVSQYLQGWGELTAGISMVLCSLLLLVRWSGSHADKRGLWVNSPFLTSFVLVSLAELFDKTQVVAASLGAAFPDAAILPCTVAAMMVIGIPSILFGALLEPYLRSPIVRGIAAGTVGILGVVTIVMALL